MIRKVGEQLTRTVLDGVGRVASQFHERRLLPADLLESDDAYLAVFDAPGATAEDVSVHCRGNTLSVNIDRYREFRDSYEMRFPGRGLSLEGEVELPDEAAVDADRADATVTQNGTLEVLIPKAPSEDEAEESADAASDDSE
jgi:HSP20 family molecular chaperone IbpA